jgi:NAD(P)-dependent dehydrogenase (short-subunit alcohol dehydrogenase family)
MGQIHVLFNNAGIGENAPAFSCDTPLEALQSSWTNILGINFGGILNVAQAFAPYMVRQENSSVIINTGSKQGITCPPYVCHWAELIAVGMRRTMCRKRQSRRILSSVGDMVFAPCKLTKRSRVRAEDCL